MFLLFSLNGIRLFLQGESFYWHASIRILDELN